MKKTYLLAFLLIVSITANVSAQETILTDINYKLLEKYIDLAKESYPRRKITIATMESVRTGIAMANLSYLEMFTAAYFYRPNDRVVITTPGSGYNPYSVNGWQFGVNINLGILLERPFVVKKAKADYRVAQLQSQDFDLTLATEVKRRYYTFVQAGAQLKINTQSYQDNKNISENSQHRFEKGEITLDAYNTSRQLVSTSSTSKIQAEVAYLEAKDSLEEIIGKKLSEVN